MLLSGPFRGYPRTMIQPSLLRSGFAAGLAAIAAVSWAQFTPRNLAVTAITDPGVGFVNDGRNGVVVREFTPSGVATGFSVTLFAGAAGAASGALTPISFPSATTWSQGPYLHRSADRRFLTLLGYGYRVAAGSLDSPTQSAANPRVVARIDSAGTVDLTTQLTTGTNTGRIRSAFTTDGSRFWVLNGATGANIGHTPLGGSSITTVFGGEAYAISHLDGELMVSGSTMWRLPGQPTGAASLTTLFTSPGLQWMMGHVWVSPTTVYTVDADASAGTPLRRYDLVGGTWTSSYSFSLATDASGAGAGAGGSGAGARSIVYDPNLQRFYALTTDGIDSGTPGQQRIVSFPLTTTAPTPAQITRHATAPASQVWMSLAWTPEPANGGVNGTYGVSVARHPSVANDSRALYENGAVSPRTVRVGLTSTANGSHRSMTLGASVSLPAGASAVANEVGVDGINRVVSFDPITRSLYLTLINDAGSQAVTSLASVIAAGFSPQRIAVGSDNRTYVLCVGRSAGSNGSFIVASFTAGALPATAPTATTTFNGGGSYSVANFHPEDIAFEGGNVRILLASRTPGTAPIMNASAIRSTLNPAGASNQALTSTAALNLISENNLLLMPVAFGFDATGQAYVLSTGPGMEFQVHRVAADWASVTATGTRYQRTLGSTLGGGSSAIHQMSAVDIGVDTVTNEVRVALSGFNNLAGPFTLTTNAAGSLRVWTLGADASASLARATLRMLPGILPLP